MTTGASWAKERKLGVAGLAAVVAGFVMLIWVNTLTSVCAPSVRPLSWTLILISLASPVAFLWAAVKDNMVVGDWVTSSHFPPTGRAGDLRGLLTGLIRQPCPAGGPADRDHLTLEGAPSKLAWAGLFARGIFRPPSELIVAAEISLRETRRSVTKPTAGAKAQPIFRHYRHK